MNLHSKILLTLAPVITIISISFAAVISSQIKSTGDIKQQEDINRNIEKVSEYFQDYESRISAVLLEMSVGVDMSAAFKGVEVRNDAIKERLNNSLSASIPGSSLKYDVFLVGSDVVNTLKLKGLSSLSWMVDMRFIPLVGYVGMEFINYNGKISAAHSIGIESKISSKMSYIVAIIPFDNVIEELFKGTDLTSGLVMGGREGVLYNNTGVSNKTLYELRGDGGDTFIEIQGDRHRYHTQAISGSRYIGYLEPASASYLAGGYFVGSFFIGLAVSIIIVLVLRSQIAGFLRKPLLNLVDACEVIAGGTYDVSLKETGTKEFDLLVRSVNNIALQLGDSNKKINDVLCFDDLTQLGNRQMLLVTLDEWMRRVDSTGESLSVMSIDIDSFSEINDLFGHSAGDSILKEMGRQVRDSIDITCDGIDGIQYLICRNSGDEFSVIIKGNYGSELTDKILNCLFRKLKSPISVKNCSLIVKVNAGVALYPRFGSSAGDVLQYSNMSLQEVKRNSRGSYLNYSSMIAAKIMDEMRLKSELKAAIMLDQFTLEFQPKKCLKSNSICEFEALLRWNHPIDGPISPSYFIPFAEREGIILEIGDWVLDHTCASVAELEALGWTDFILSFNVSPQQLQDTSFLQSLTEKISEYGIDPSHLEVEITEHSLARDLNQTLSCINGIKNLGIKIALDDFGTGYSSLSYLELLPIDTIKIDRHFITGATNSHASMTIVDVMVTLSKCFELRSVAEGVECQDEYDLAVEKGCEYAQGFFISRPVPLEDIKKYSHFCKG